MQKIYFVSHIWLLDPVNGANRAKSKAQTRSKYQIVNFEVNSAFEVL